MLLLLLLLLLNDVLRNATRGRGVFGIRPADVFFRFFYFFFIFINIHVLPRTRLSNGFVVRKKDCTPA